MYDGFHEKLDNAVEDSEDMIKDRYTWIKGLWKKTLRFFKRNEQQQQRIQTTIQEWVDIDILYRLQLLSSVIIATFGLLTDSTPVIIGAMLIAPLLQPIQAISFAIATGKMKLYFKSLKYLVLSIAFSLIGAIILATLVPFGTLTSEILARTTPTILDLWVAFASGMIAFLVLWYKKLSGTIVGAAIAASLLPPLCATGIWLYFLNRDVAVGTFLLFLANLVAIIFAWLLFFFLYGFAPQYANKKNKIKQIVIISITTILVSIPLRTSMIRISDNLKTRTTISNTLKLTLPTIDPAVQLVEFSADKTKTIQNVALTIKVPESVLFTNEYKDLLSEKIAFALKEPVALSLEIMPISSIYIPQDVVVSHDEKITTTLTNYVVEHYKDVYILSTEVKNLSDKYYVGIEMFSENPMHVTNLIHVFESHLQETFDKTYAVRIRWLDDIASDVKKSELEDKLFQEFSKLFPHSVIHTFDVARDITNSSGQSETSLSITTIFQTSQSPQKTDTILARRKYLKQRDYWYPVSINASISYIDEKTY